MKDEAVKKTVRTFKQHSVQAKRRIEPAREGDPELGPLNLLPGTCSNIRTEHRLDSFVIQGRMIS